MMREKPEERGIILLSACTWKIVNGLAEARTEMLRGLVENRFSSPLFSSTISGVLYHTGENSSCWWSMTWRWNHNFLAISFKCTLLFGEAYDIVGFLWAAACLSTCTCLVYFGGWLTNKTNTKDRRFILRAYIYSRKYSDSAHSCGKNLSFDRFQGSGPVC